MASPTKPDKLAKQLMSELKSKNPDSRKIAMTIAQGFHHVSHNNQVEALPNPKRMPAIQKALSKEGLGQEHINKLKSIYQKDGDFFNDMNIKDSGFNQFIASFRHQQVKERVPRFMQILEAAAKQPIEKRIAYMDKHQDNIFKMFEEMRNAGLDKDLKAATTLFKEQFINPGLQHEAKQQPLKRPDAFKKHSLKKASNSERKQASKSIADFRKTQIARKKEIKASIKPPSGPPKP